MKSFVLSLIAVILPVLCVPGEAQEKGPPPRNLDEEQIARVVRLLDETTMKITGHAEPMSLNTLLAAAAERLPKDQKLTVTFDKEAFGPDLPRLLNAPIRFRTFGDRSLHDVLGDAMREASRVTEADYAVRPMGVVVTRPRLAVRNVRYDVRDVLALSAQTLVRLAVDSEAPGQPLAPADGPNALVHLLATKADLRPWESIEVLNGRHLTVTATPSRHHDVESLLASLRKCSDLTVYMNARLIEVDRAFYTADVAPLFAAKKDEKPPAAVAITGPLLKKLTRRSVLQESEEMKLRPERESVFLSRQSTFRFAAGNGPGTGLAGVSFAVRPEVSPDRRYLRLRITQQVAELIGIDKAKVLDPGTGRETDSEVPNVRKTTVSGTIQIADGQPILMPVSYRPPGKDTNDKMWLVLARPMIWIEAEARERGAEYTPGSVWDWDVEDEPRPAKIKRLPLTDDTREILQAILTDILTGKEHKSSREFYGGDKDRLVALIDGGDLGWPEGFKPDLHGYTVVPARRDPFGPRKRILAIRLDKFDLKQTKSNSFDGPIAISVYSASGDVLGGLNGFCFPKKVGKHWAVEWSGWER